MAKGKFVKSLIDMAESAGLDMAEAARMARAKEMGFNTRNTFYRGQNSSVDEFSLDKSDPEGYFGRGVYFTNNKDDVINNYGENNKDMEQRIARAISRADSRLPPNTPYQERAALKDSINKSYRGGQPNFYETNLAGNNFLDIEGDWIDTSKSQEILNNLEKNSEVNIDEIRNAIDDASTHEGISAKDFDRVLRDNAFVLSDGSNSGIDLFRDSYGKSLNDSGYDGVFHSGNVFDDVLDVPEDTTHAVVFNPSKIRSTKAAFDPAKKDSSNILAGTATIGGIGAGAALTAAPQKSYADTLHDMVMEAKPTTKEIMDAQVRREKYLQSIDYLNRDDKALQAPQNQTAIDISDAMNTYNKTRKKIVNPVLDAILPAGELPAEYFQKLGYGDETTLADKIQAALGVM